MPCEPDHLLLRRFADARDRGDVELAAELWEQLAVNNFDRVRQIVKAFRFSPAAPACQTMSAAARRQEAYLRVIAMGANFREREVGQFYAALMTCVRNSCHDYGRKELRHDKRAAGSLDSTFEPDGEAGPFDKALAAYDAAPARSKQATRSTPSTAAPARAARCLGDQPGSKRQATARFSR